MNIHKSLLVVLALLGAVFVKAQERFAIIPYPNKLIETEGDFEFKNKLTSYIPNTFKSEFDVASAIFNDEYCVQLISASTAQLKITLNTQLSKEAYKLNVSKTGIQIEASTGAGVLYAFQTLRQLMRLTGEGSYRIACCQIEDSPALTWRAFMLDVSRHFKSKELIKKLLDQMVLLKMNIFHWHLTDDQGWRIQIKKYPLLTDIGAWRDSTLGRENRLNPTNGNWIWATTELDKNPHGGFYSQEDIKEIVNYALKRHITVIPEIEMPGHATAAIAAYPWLISTGEKTKVTTTFGIKNMVYNVGNDKVYQFLEDVLTEVMPLFPSKIIHIGGDEVKYDNWKNSPEIQSLMQKENLKTYADVQIHFTNRISNFIEKKGYRMMGWNEILGNVHLEKNEGQATSKLAPNSIIHFWKGDSLLLNEAIEKGYQVVNSGKFFTYMDYPIKRTTLSMAYHFNPIPKGLSDEKARRVLGLGCQMWGEVTPRVIDTYRYVFPRIAAYAEVGWTQDSHKDYTRFTSSLQKLKKYWDSKGIYYEE